MSKIEYAYALVRFDRPPEHGVKGTIYSWHETYEEAALAKMPRDREVGPHYDILARPAGTAWGPPGTEIER
jgi:hypothetical protein